MDVRVERRGAKATVAGETDEGEAFVEAWLLGVLSVEDLGRITVTSEVVGDLARAAAERGLEAVVQ